MKKILIITAILVLGFVGLRFVLTKFGEFQQGKILKSRAVANVELSEVKKTDIYKTVEIPGRIQSMDKVDLVARVDGYLQKKHFQEGDYVKKGQILFTIEQTQYINALNQAKAQVENAKATLYKASRDYDRGAELVKKDYISKSTYDGLFADKKAAQASLKSAQAQLAEAQRNYSYTTIKAPVDGKIGSLQIQEGNYVGISSGVLATITKINPIYVRYSVDSKKLEELKTLGFMSRKGEDKVKVEVILTNGDVYPIKGVQDFWDNQISTSTGTMDFRATIDNSNHTLIPNDFVKVKVYSNIKNTVLIVPQEFVQQDAKGKYVFVVDDKNTAKMKYFEDAGQYEKYWIVASGLVENEKYICTNLRGIMEGMPVKVVQEQPENEEKEVKASN